MAEKKLKLYSIAEYLMQEEQAMHKSEFEQGQIRALNGGTLNHGIIGNNINHLSKYTRPIESAFSIGFLIIAKRSSQSHP